MARRNPEVLLKDFTTTPAIPTKTDKAVKNRPAQRNGMFPLAYEVVARRMLSTAIPNEAAGISATSKRSTIAGAGAAFSGRRAYIQGRLKSSSGNEAGLGTRSG
jgi:hypothetical protein